MKRNKSTTISILCPQCRLHTTKLLSECEANNNVVCAYCEEIINLRNEHWHTALRNAHNGSEQIAS